MRRKPSFLFQDFLGRRTQNRGLLWGSLVFPKRTRMVQLLPACSDGPFRVNLLEGCADFGDQWKQIVRIPACATAGGKVPALDGALDLKVT